MENFCSYEGEDGTHVEQEGELKRMNDEDMGESVKGSYSYKDDDGMTYSVRIFFLKLFLHSEVT